MTHAMLFFAGLGTGWTPGIEFVWWMDHREERKAAKR